MREKLMDLALKQLSTLRTLVDDEYPTATGLIDNIVDTIKLAAESERAGK